MIRDLINFLGWCIKPFFNYSILSKSFKSTPFGYLKRFLYIYIGFGYLHQMIRKPKAEEYSDRKPSNFLLWIIGLYVALFGLAAQRYEIRINRLNNLFNTYIELLDKDVDPGIYDGFIQLQKSVVPKEPKVLEFWTTFQSFVEEEPFPDVVQHVGNIAPAYFREEIGSLKDLESKQVLDLDDYERFDFKFEKCHLEKIRIRNKVHAKLILDSTYINQMAVWGSGILEIEQFNWHAERDYSYGVQNMGMYSSILEMSNIHNLTSYSSIISRANISVLDPGSWNINRTLFLHCNIEGEYLGFAQMQRSPVVYVDCNIFVLEKKVNEFLNSGFNTFFDCRVNGEEIGRTDSMGYFINKLGLSFEDSLNNKRRRILGETHALYSELW